MSLGGVPQALIGAVDDWLQKKGQPPQVGAGQPAPAPVNTGTPRIGAVQATPGTFAGPTGLAAPAKIGAAAVPQQQAQPAAQPTDTYDPSKSPMVGAGSESTPNYAARYHDWASSEPAKLSPDAGKPSMLRKIGGIAAGAATGFFNPTAGGQIGSAIINGPRNELEREHQQAEDTWNRQGKEISTEAGLADTQTQMDEREAQAAKSRSDVALAGHPKPKEEEWSVVPGVQGPNGEPVQQEKNSGQMRVAPLGGSSLVDKAPKNQTLDQEYDEAVRKGDTARATQIQGEIKNLAGAKREPTTDAGTWSLQQDDKGQTVEFNSKTGAVRPAPAGVRAKGNESGPGGKFDEANATQASKDTETARGGDFRYRSMAGSLPKAKSGDQQAMLNLLTNHIGMTLGMQKGARITKDILNEAQKSTPWLQGIEAKFDDQGYLSGVVLTPQQMDQMMGLATSQRANAWIQAIETAKQAGVADKVQVPKDVRVRVIRPDGKPGTIPGSQLAQAEDEGYTVNPEQ